MSTKSNRSSGTQHNARGVTQGNTLVDPKSGLPIDVIEDSEGKKRLAVDAKITAQIGELQVELDYNEDSVQIGDPNTGTTLKINPDGSIDSNVEVDAADGDNIAISDGVDNATLSHRNDKVGLDTNVLNRVFTKPFNKIQVLSKNDDGDPLIVVTKLNNVLVETATIVYDIDGDFESVEVT